TAAKDGFTARGEDYFFDMYDALGENMFKLFIVECEGKAIAGSVLLAYAGKSWHMFAGSSDEYRETLPNFLMQWEMMRWSRDNGYMLYDMRGIAGEGDKLTPIEGLVRFKKRFGGELCTFIGRIDIIYDKKADAQVKLLMRFFEFARKIMGRK
ncbi:MAG: peptidoglycan bridge formation glycyltransferase FemA/FemB family protein, partial [Oscillospiraceae bacterium]|nr:peptidoglycan bridge formation glycyltransferase FemA/FemB family protein [Oscillospiraceae bacterium]